MQCNLLISRVQHGVGQGGFHTSSFYLQSADEDSSFEHRFDLVFDCGTLSKGPDGSSPQDFIAARIEAHLPSAPIVDALFLSHLDSDHFNGVEALCSIKQVKQVFLPYFQQAELALFMAQHVLAHDSAALGPAGLAAAVNALGGGPLFGVPVTLVGAPLDEGPRGELRERQRDQPGERISVVEIDFAGVRRPVGQTLPRGSELGLQWAGLELPWTLLPWSYKQSPAGLARLLADVPMLAALAQAATTVKARDMEALLTLRPQIRASLSKIIKAAGGVEAADFNAPSICLYSGPRDDDARIEESQYRWRGTGYSLAQDDPIGWITTGDAVLGRYETEFIGVFATALKQCGTYVVPHHGARKNHSSALILNAKGRFALICAKHGSKFHPHEEVLKALEQVKDDHRIATEYLAGGVHELAWMRFKR